MLEDDDGTKYLAIFSQEEQMPEDYRDEFILESMTFEACLELARSNPEIDSMALPPCHCLFQFYVADGRLSCQLYQRSADVFLGVPFNIASYALLTQMIAQVCGYELGDFVHTLGDAHIYLNHFQQVETQLSREVRSLPQMTINLDKKDIYSFEYEDFTLTNYNPWPGIKAPIAV